jgi:hypothetical protein
MVVFDDMYGLVDRGTPGVRSGAVVAEVAREVAGLESWSRAHRDDETLTMTREERAHDYAVTVGAWEQFSARERADLKSDLSHSDRNNYFLRSCALRDLEWRLAVLAPCYAVVAAGHAKRLSRRGTP